MPAFTSPARSTTKPMLFAGRRRSGYDGEHPREGERVVLGVVDGGGGGEDRQEEEGKPAGCEAGEEATLGVGARSVGVEGGVVGIDVGKEGVLDVNVEEPRRKRAESGRTKAL